MTPLKLKAFLQKQKQASVAEMMRILAVDEALVLSLLRFWLQRGDMIRVDSASCGGCAVKCHTQEVYQWKQVAYKDDV